MSAHPDAATPASTPKTHPPLTVLTSAYGELCAHVLAGFPAEVRGTLLGDRAARTVRCVAPEAGPPPAAEGLEVLGTYQSCVHRPASPPAAAVAPAGTEHALLLLSVHGADGPEGDGVATRITDLRAWRRAHGSDAPTPEPLVLADGRIRPPTS